MTNHNTTRILYVITKLELGGAQRYLLDLIQGIDRKRFTPFLFTAHDGMMVAQALSIPGLRCYRSAFLERRINPIKDFLALIELYIYIKNNNITIVHTHSSKAGIIGRLAARAAGVRVIMHSVHGWSFHDYQPRMYYHLCVWLERFCARFTNHLVVVSLWDRQVGLNHCIVPKENYTLIRFGIIGEDLGRGQPPSAARKDLGLNEADPVVGMVACLKSQKAPLDFIRLAVAIKKDLPQCKFVLVGDGPLRQKVARAIIDSGLEKDILLTGWRRDVPFILTAFDVCVLTSSWEGLPIAVMEAMVARVPVVATDTGGIREVVLSGNTGYLVKVADIADLREKVLELLKDPGLRARFAERAAQHIQGQEFSFEHMVQSAERLYLESHAMGSNA